MSIAAKERHYWSQLRAALTAGQWLAQTPAKDPRGGQLSWSELFRKFNKHCKGFHDVSEIASQTYGLALLLSTYALNEDDDYRSPRDLSIELGEECILPPERMEEATQGYEKLKSLQSANSDSVHFALAYYAYALGRPSDCLSHLAQVPDFSQIQQFIPSTTRSSTSNLLTIPAPPSASSSVTGGFSSFVDTSAQEVRDGRGWALTETFRSLCLQGMCHERMEPDAPRKALRAYAASLPAFRVLQSTEFSSFVSPLARLPSGKLDYSTFVQLRELWRWVERLLWRAICLSARISNVHADDEGTAEDSLWMWLEKYTVCSATWPPTFRTEHRSTISSIYLRALVLRHGVPAAAVPNDKMPLWVQTARSVVQDYRAILSVSTKFPKAGDRNLKVEEFVDLCVAVWEASGAVGEHAGWALEVLWWATRLTFNSSRVLRHMTRLLYFSGDANLAKRSLRLYIQVVSKAWLASKQGAGESVEEDEADGSANTPHEGYIEDTDTDVHWVETMVLGARMLCKLAGEAKGRKDIDDVKEAKDILGKARERMGSVDTNPDSDDPSYKRLQAEVALAEGIVDSLLAIKGQDAHTRSGLLDSAHNHLLSSLSIYPLPEAHYHIALSYARDAAHHDVSLAIQHAGAAAEASPRDVRCWHLLGLLLTAQEKWRDAEVVLEHATSVNGFGSEDVDTIAEGGPESEVHLTSLQTETTTITMERQPSNDGSVRTRVQSQSSFALSINLSGDNTPTPTPITIPRTFTSSTVTASTPTASAFPLGTPVPTIRTHSPIEDVTCTVLPPSCTTFVPPSSDLLRSILDPVPPSKQDVFEWGLQLRMTQMAVMEVVRGPEGAEEGWLEVFAWVAEKRGAGPGSADDGPATARTSQSLGGPRRSLDIDPRHLNMSSLSIAALNAATVATATTGPSELQAPIQAPVSASLSSSSNDADPAPPPITISPASPDEGAADPSNASYNGEKKSAGFSSLGLGRRSSSLERSESRDKEKGDTSKSKKVQQMLKQRVQKGQERISAVGRKLGHGVQGVGGGLRRSSSTPDFHLALQQTSYQASSIHSRRRLSSALHSEAGTPRTLESPTPPPAPPPVPQSSSSSQRGVLPSPKNAKENRLLSDLWLMSSATFRRLSKIDQAKGAIQEGEVKDESNPNVWVQLALYYSTLGHHQHAISTLQKALFIDPDDVPATVHLARLYLTRRDASLETSSTSPHLDAEGKAEAEFQSHTEEVDLACGLLTYVSRGRGWDVPEVWYYLAKAYGMQGRKDKEVEALEKALRLSEGRGVREISAALWLCI